MVRAQPVLLTIDEDPSIRMGFRTYLESNGYTVLEAESGRQGLEVWRDNSVDLILVDLHMADMDGFAVLAEVRRQEPDLPVVVVSGDRIIDVAKALRLGATDYLLKPVEDMSILLHAIEKGLERSCLLKASKNFQGRLEMEVTEKTEELCSLYNRLERVVETTKELIGCGEIDESGPMILQEFGYHLNAGGGSFYEVGENDLRCICSLEGGHAAQMLQLPLQDDTVFSRALGASEPFIIDNINLQDWPASGWSGYSSPSCIVFPLWDRRGRIFAILTLHNPKQGSFTVHDREIGAILASYVSEALQTAAAMAAMKHHEGRMLQSQKLEEMGILAGSIAHDFNNVLSAIVGYADLCLFSEELSEPVKRNLEQVKKASQRARGLVGQILSFSRVEASCESVIDVVPIVTEVLKLLRSSIPASITIEQDVVEDVGRIEADPGRIHQVLMNLCANAAHAMREKGGTLRIEVVRVQVGWGADEPGHLRGKNCIRMRVADTGEGIPEEMLARIFAPYFTTKQKGEKIGMGLAAVQEIVGGAGGVVTVKSQVGRGSVFDVYFPLVESAMANTLHPAVDRPAMPVGNERILFVDDEETLAEMASEMLQKLGYHVHLMTSSVEALKLLQSSINQYDLIITDQTMPGLSGLDLARAIVALRSELPIILYSGHSAAISESETREAGISKVLMKPLRMALLSQIVRQILDEKQQRMD